MQTANSVTNQNIHTADFTHRPFCITINLENELH